MVLYPKKNAPERNALQRGKKCRTELTTRRYKGNASGGVSCGQSLAAISIRRSPEMSMFLSGALFRSSRQYDAGKESQRSHPRTRSLGTPRSVASCCLPHVLIISLLLCMQRSMVNITPYVKVLFTSTNHG